MSSKNVNNHPFSCNVMRIFFLFARIELNWYAIIAWAIRKWRNSQLGPMRIDFSIWNEGGGGENAYLTSECGSQGDDDKDIEHGGSDDGAYTDVRLKCNAHHRGEQFRRRRSGRHEGRAGHVFRKVELLGNGLQWGHEEVVADDGQRWRWERKIRVSSRRQVIITVDTRWKSSHIISL